MAAAGAQRALQQLGQTVNPTPGSPLSSLLAAVHGGGNVLQAFQDQAHGNPIDAIFGQGARPATPPSAPADQRVQMLNSIAATNPGLAAAIAAKLGISYTAPGAGPGPGFTQSLDPNNPNVAGYNPIPTGGGPVGGSSPVSIDPAAPLGSNWGQPPWWPVRVQDPPGPPIQPLPPGTDLGVLSAQRRRSY